MSEFVSPLHVGSGRDETELRDGLVEAARAIVVAKGVSGLTRTTLAQAAGVSPWDVSRLFRTLEDLLATLRDRRFAGP